MEEAQHLADRVVVLARGRVIAEGTPDTLGRDARRRSSFRAAGVDGRCRCPRRDVERGTAALPHRDPDRATSPRCSRWAADARRWSSRA